MKKYISAFFLSIFLLTSCGQTIFDDFFDIHEEIDQLKDNEDKLSQRLENANYTLATIQAIVDVLNSGYYVDKVVPIYMDDVEVAKQVCFTNGKSISIYHGKNGENGHTPALGVINIDGDYFWTLDGDILLDDDGNMIPTINEVVKSPELTIRNEYWYISFDGGATWKQLGRATGEDGLDGKDGIEHIISIDDSSEEGVSFILYDGTVLFVPYCNPVYIILDTQDTEVGISGRETVRVNYYLTDIVEGTHIIVSSDGFYTALLVEEDESKGHIDITCPGTYRDGFVNVTVYAKNGVSDMKVIRFYEKMMGFDNGNVYSIPETGGRVRIPYISNFKYRVEVDPGNPWLEVQEESPSERKGDIVLVAPANQGLTRSGLAYIYAENGINPYATIVVLQQSMKCHVANASFVIEAGGGTAFSDVSSSYGLSVVIPEENTYWLKGDVLPGGQTDSYKIALTAEPNPDPYDRSSVIRLYSSSGTTLLAELQLVQKASNANAGSELVFTVRPNYSNDFTAYLPIRKDAVSGKLNCYVDWGDGSGDHITGISRDEKNFKVEDYVVCHHYDGLTVGKTFEVVVSGSVPELYAGYIPEAFRSSVVEIKQWGNTGLKNMSHAFEGFSGLETLPLDDSRAFADVTDFSQAFENCPRLTTVSGHLFDYAGKAISFRSAFHNCPELAIIPDGLFDGCTSGTDFAAVFENCASIRTIPEGLFSNCSKADNFQSAFRSCISLSAIPADLFAGCPDVTSFTDCFNNCQSIKDVPSGLFDHNRKAVRFAGTFFGCGSLTSESPYTVIDGEKVHLYERIYHPDHFNAPIDHFDCFNGCDKLEDWNQIPGVWRYSSNN